MGATTGAAVPQIAVVGCGAIGGVLAGGLARAGRDVVAVDGWFEHVETIRRDGLSVTGPDESFVTAIPTLHLDELDRLPRPIDVLVLAPKCYDTEVLARLAAPYLADRATVISAQNGVMEERLPGWFRDHQVIGCVVRTAAELFVPGRVVRRLGAAWPTLMLGELEGANGSRIDTLVELLRPAGEIRTTGNMWGELWAKLVQNLMASPAGGVTGATTRVLWSEPVLVDVAVALAGECITVAEGLGHRVEPIFNALDASRFRAAHEGDQAARVEAVQLLATMAAQRVGQHENLPSLAHDIQKGRRTENDYLSGHVIRHARALGLPAPVNEGVAALVDQVSTGALAPGLANRSLLADTLR
jgi:2-dehydropantoate 2-reductase